MAICITGYVLPPRLQAELAVWCAAIGDDPLDVISDLVQEFLDDLVAEAEGISPKGCSKGQAEPMPPPPRKRGRVGRGFLESKVAGRIRGRFPP
jgi:hypothetical protein